MAADRSLTVPSKAFTFTMKAKATGADHYEAMEGMRGERDRWAGPPRNVRLAQAIYFRYLVANVLTSWDRTHFVEIEEGRSEVQVLPITPETVGAIENHDDYEYIVGQAASRVQLRDEAAEANFKKPSTPTTAATTSKPKTSRRSRS